MDAHAGTGVPAKVWIVFAVELGLFAALLFGAAGTFDWPGAWALLVLFGAAGVALTAGLARADPALLDERMKMLGGQPDQPFWDRILVVALIALCVVWLATPGLDRRFGWSHVPVWLEVLGAPVMLASLWGAYRVMLQNSYLAPTVRVQSERGHAVISTGAYAVVRHPFYAVLLPFFPAVALLLGSWWGVAVSAPIIALLAWRATREERHLARELPGLRRLHGEGPLPPRAGPLVKRPFPTGR